MIAQFSKLSQMTQLTQVTQITQITRDWDVCVIGAGPAGTAAAITAARAGQQTLLVDRAAFPRSKVCGCCISPAGLALLTQTGLNLKSLQAHQVASLALYVRHRRYDLPTRAGMVIARDLLDSALATHAMHHGAIFLDQTSATVRSLDRDHATIDLTTPDTQTTIRARAVIAADGLQGRALNLIPNLATNIATRSRMGLGATISLPQTLAADTCQPAVISMYLAQHGYVGLAPLQDGRLNIAAAINPRFIASHDSPAHAIAAILAQSTTSDGLLEAIVSQSFRGTPLLTRTRSRLESHRLLISGDAGGYAEPFTGEGMTWALAAGLRAGELASAIVNNTYQPGTWQRWWQHTIAPQQRRSLRLASMLRFPSLIAASLSLASTSRRALALSTMLAGSWRGDSTLPATGAHSS